MTIRDERLRRRALFGYASILWRLYVGMLFYQRRQRRHGSFAPFRRAYAIPRSLRVRAVLG